MRCLQLLHVVSVIYTGLTIANPIAGLQANADGVLAKQASCQIQANPDVTDLAGTDYTANVKAAKLTNGHNYRLVLYEPKADKPYILFLHGFPSTSYDWRRQFKYFSDLGYGIIAPDLLGFGGTDKPIDLQSYRLKPMADDLNSLLGCVGATKVISVGHDWGSLLQSRFITYHPERILATAFLDIGYFAPPSYMGGTAASALNAATRLTLGYPVFGYWFFFNTPESASIMDAHCTTTDEATIQPQAASTLMYTNDLKLQETNFCDGDALRTWLLANKTAPAAPWLPPSELKTYETIVSHNGGYAGGLQWYKAIVGNINSDDETAASYTATKQIKVPTLLIKANKDPIGLPFFAELLTRPYASQLTERSVDSGHFVQVEQSAEVNRHLGEFLSKLT